MAINDLFSKGSGILGNYSEMSDKDLDKNVSAFLMEGEVVERGFKLVRDMLIFTDKRILLFDKQGVTGAKTRVVSINYGSIVEVSVETAGAGFDDSEINLTYMKSAYLKTRDPIYETKTFEFPKKFDVASLYVFLEEIAHENYLRLNS